MLRLRLIIMKRFIANGKNLCSVWLFFAPCLEGCIMPQEKADSEGDHQFSDCVLTSSTRNLVFMEPHEATLCFFQF